MIIDEKNYHTYRGPQLNDEFTVGRDYKLISRENGFSAIGNKGGSFHFEDGQREWFAAKDKAGVPTFKYEFYDSRGTWFTECYAVNMFKAVEIAFAEDWAGWLAIGDTEPFFCKREGSFPLVRGRRRDGYTLFDKVFNYAPGVIHDIDGTKVDGFSNTHQNVPFAKNITGKISFEDPNLIEISGKKQPVGDDDA